MTKEPARQPQSRQPDPSAGLDLVSFVRLRVKTIIDETEIEDIILPSRKEKVQLKHRHNSLKQKGGRPPADYTGVEILIDLRDALTQLETLQTTAEAEGRKLTHAEVKDVLRTLVQGYLMIKELRRH